jgi:hypothetical protein
MAVYSIFLALGLNISVRPILDHKDNKQFDSYKERLEEKLYIEYYRDRPRPDYAHDLDKPFVPLSNTPEPDLLATASIPFIEDFYIGRKLGDVLVTTAGGEGDDYEGLCEAWDGDLRKVNWLTEPKWREKAIAHMTYGNEAGIGTMYSHAAMVVEVPPASLRSRTKEESMALD